MESKHCWLAAAALLVWSATATAGPKFDILTYAGKKLGEIEFRTSGILTSPADVIAFHYTQDERGNTFTQADITELRVMVDETNGTVCWAGWGRTNLPVPDTRDGCGPLEEQPGQIAIDGGLRAGTVPNTAGFNNFRFQTGEPNQVTDGGDDDADLYFVPNVPGRMSGQRVREMLVALNGVRRAATDNPPPPPALWWRNDLAAFAQAWATNRATTTDCNPPGVLTHRPSPIRIPGTTTTLGENMYWAGPITNNDGSTTAQAITPANVVGPNANSSWSWAGERQFYNYAQNTCSAPPEPNSPWQTCGHYTQIVWRNTTEVGCGMAVCPNNGQVWVCNFRPAGNIAGQRPY